MQDFIVLSVYDGGAKVSVMIDGFIFRDENVPEEIKSMYNPESFDFCPLDHLTELKEAYPGYHIIICEDGNIVYHFAEF